MFSPLDPLKIASPAFNQKPPQQDTAADQLDQAINAESFNRILCAAIPAPIATAISITIHRIVMTSIRIPERISVARVTSTLNLTTRFGKAE